MGKVDFLAEEVYGFPSLKKSQNRNEFSKEAKKLFLSKLSSFLMAVLNFFPNYRSFQLFRYNGDFYLLPSPKDSSLNIPYTVKEMVEMLNNEARVGVNISSLRPRGSFTFDFKEFSSGAVEWSTLLDRAAELVREEREKPNNFMLNIDDWHPDLLEFIDSTEKFSSDMTVCLSDQFMDALERDDFWSFSFPDYHRLTFDRTINYKKAWKGNLREWKKRELPIDNHKMLPAEIIWKKLLRAIWKTGRPNILFIDRASATDNSSYYIQSRGVVPYAKQPLPTYSSGLVGFLNLPRVVNKKGELVEELLKANTYQAVRFLDELFYKNTLLPDWHEERYLKRAERERRIWLGVAGLAEYFIRRKIRYGSPESLREIDRLFQIIAEAAYSASIDLAIEKEPFKNFDPDEYLKGEFPQNLSEKTRKRIKKHGIRNVSLLGIYPAKEISDLFETSPGIEPYREWTYTITDETGREITEDEPIFKLWKEEFPNRPLPEQFVTAKELTPQEQAEVQIAVQKWVDAAAVTTLYFPESATTEEIEQIIKKLYKNGVKVVSIQRLKS